MIRNELAPAIQNQHEHEKRMNIISDNYDNLKNLCSKYIEDELQSIQQQMNRKIDKMTEDLNVMLRSK